VAEAARTVRSSLTAAGASSEETLEAGRRVAAEVALWMPRARACTFAAGDGSEDSSTITRCVAPDLQRKLHVH
jgi:hypothetical protein